MIELTSNLTFSSAIQVLIEAAKEAQKRGAFPELEEAAQVHAAIKKIEEFKQPIEQPEQAQKKEKVKVSKAGHTVPKVEPKLKKAE